MRIRMRGRVTGLVLVALLLSGQALGASEIPVSPEECSLKEAIHRTLERHPEIAAAVAAAEGAEALRLQALSTRAPRVGLGAGYAFRGPVPEIQVDPGIPGIPPIRQELGDEHNAHLTLQLGWRLWDGGSRRSWIEAVEARASAADLQAQEARVRLALEVRLLAYGAALAGEVKRLMETSLASAEEHASQAEARFRAGTGTDLERSRAAVRVWELESERVEASRLRRRLETELALLAGSDPRRGLRIRADLDVGAAPELPDVEPGPAHPSVRALEALVEAAHRAVRAAEGKSFPTLELGASLGEEYPFYFETEWSETWQVGLSLTHLLWSGGERKAKVAEACAARREAESALAALLERLARQAEKIRSEHDRARAAIRASREREEQAERYLNAARVGARAGFNTDLDVRDAEIALDAARLALREAQHRACAARARWLALEGKTLEVNP